MGRRFRKKDFFSEQLYVILFWDFIFLKLFQLGIRLNYSRMSYGSISSHECFIVAVLKLITIIIGYIVYKCRPTTVMEKFSSNRLFRAIVFSKNKTIFIYIIYVFVLHGDRILGGTDFQSRVSSCFRSMNFDFTRSFVLCQSFPYAASY